MSVADNVAATLASAGVRHVFGLVGGSNFLLTNALVAHGMRFVSSRHEGGAISAADGYRRVGDALPVVSLHNGNGLTNAITGLVEAVKSNTPMLVLVPEARRSARDLTFYLDQETLVRATGAEFHTITSPANAVLETARAWRRAAVDGATVVLNLPLDVLDASSAAVLPPAVTPVTRPAPSAAAIERIIEALRGSRRPVFIAGRGARGAARSLRALAAACGALVATSAGARGLFAGDEWDLDVSGGFSTPGTVDLIREADVVVAWGASLNVWTLRGGTIISPDATLLQIDMDPAALGRVPRVAFGVCADVEQTADACRDAWERTGGGEVRFRDDSTRERIASGSHWRDVAFDDVSDEHVIDPRALTTALDALVPRPREICVDIGNFSAFPSLYFELDDAESLCAPLGFASVGLGLAAAIGASFARPDRQVVACLGDGGLLMAASELETVVRERLPMLVVVYNDHAYGAESLQFGPGGHPTDTVVFPDADLAAVARGYGWNAITARSADDLAPIADWLRGPRERPFLIDAKIAPVKSFVMDHMAEILGHG